jgi:hypothetical protein
MYQLYCNFSKRALGRFVRLKCMWEFIRRSSQCQTEKSGEALSMLVRGSDCWSSSCPKKGNIPSRPIWLLVHKACTITKNTPPLSPCGIAPSQPFSFLTLPLPPHKYTVGKVHLVFLALAVLLPLPPPDFSHGLCSSSH